jgi:hypothetical protein
MEQLHERSEVAGGYQVNRRQLLASGAALVQVVGAEDEPFSWVGDTRDLDTGHVISTSTVKSLDDDPTQFDLYDMLKTRCSLTIPFDEVYLDGEGTAYRGAWYVFDEPVTARIIPLPHTRDAYDWRVEFDYKDHDTVDGRVTVTAYDVALVGFERAWDEAWNETKLRYCFQLKEKKVLFVD